MLKIGVSSYSDIFKCMAFMVRAGKALFLIYKRH